LPFGRFVGSAAGGQRPRCAAGGGRRPGRVLADDASRTPSAPRCKGLGFRGNCLNSRLENEPEREQKRLLPESTVEVFKLMITLE
jgi:hypothetical protein